MKGNRNSVEYIKCKGKVISGEKLQLVYYMSIYRTGAFEIKMHSKLVLFIL